MLLSFFKAWQIILMSRMLEIECKATDSFDVAAWVMADCSSIKTVGKYSMKTQHEWLAILGQPVIRIILTIIIRIRIPVLHMKLKTSTFRCFDYIFPDLLLSSLTHFFLPFHLLAGLHQSSENGISFKGTWHSGDKCTDMELSFTHQEGKQQASACELSPVPKLECR